MTDKIVNVSAEGSPEPGVRPTRTLNRDPLGKFVSKPLPHRKPVLIDSSDGPVHIIGADGGIYPAFNAYQAHSNRLADRVAYRMSDDALVRGINHSTNIDCAKARP